MTLRINIESLSQLNLRLKGILYLFCRKFSAPRARLAVCSFSGFYMITILILTVISCFLLTSCEGEWWN